MFNLLQKKSVILTLLGSISPSFTLIKFSNSSLNYKILVNYNGQAELLLSLGIYPDYFPYQFKQRSLYDYLTNVGKYLVVNEHTFSGKKEFGRKLQNRLNTLISKVSTFGPSLWNEDLYSGGLVNKNTQFWSSKKVDYLFLEQFIVDDSADPLFLLQTVPKHTHLAVTNFRAARDPYTIFGEEVYQHFKKQRGSSGGGQINGNNQTAHKLYQYYKSFRKITPDNLYRSAKYIDFWNSFCDQVNKLKLKAQDGQELDISKFFDIPKKRDKIFVLFDEDGKKDRALAEKFQEVIFTEDEQKALNARNEEATGSHLHYQLSYLSSNGGTQPSVTASTQSPSTQNSICSSPSPSGLTKVSVANYLPINPSDDLLSQLPQKVHHPALEHQTLKGSSPVSEGTQKELLVYLAQMAVALYNVSKSSNFSSVFKDPGDTRKEWIENAFTNAVAIAKAYKQRIKNIREYLQDIGVVDSKFNPESGCYRRDSSKTLALVSYPPSQLGAGNATIQTVSKYSFIYSELGLQEVLPSSLRDTNAVKADSSEKNYYISDDIFGLDDNGWWWNLGDFNLSDSRLNSFKSTADSVILLATEDDFNILNSGDNPKLSSLKTLLKDKNSNKFSTSSYHLWNEGLRSPIALNLLLDVLVEQLRKQFDSEGNANIQSSSSSTSTECSNSRSKRDSSSENSSKSKECKYQEAMNWGDYWTEQFVDNKAKPTETSRTPHKVDS